MQAILPLGNDIVDLRLHGNVNSAANPRYVERVLAPEERESASFVASDHRVFWSYWAAKEAAYKALVKLDPGLVFAHRRFLVRPETAVALADRSGSANGVVLHESWRVLVSWVWNDEWVHCLTGPEDSRYRVCALSQHIHHASFSAMKKAEPMADASIVVRLLALSLLEEHGIEDAEIVRATAGRRKGPPYVLQKEKIMSNVDISLSHDGRYAAAAIHKLPGVTRHTGPAA